jgi:hypothetical protein
MALPDGDAAYLPAAHGKPACIIPLATPSGPERSACALSAANGIDAFPQSAPSAGYAGLARITDFCGAAEESLKPARIGCAIAAEPRFTLGGTGVHDKDAGHIAAARRRRNTTTRHRRH